jgi:hypothetical protein
MRNTKRSSVRDIINDINRTIRFMNEAYMMDDEDAISPEAVEPEMEDVPQEEMPMRQQQQQPQQQGGENTTNLAAKDERIIQMRELALQGLQDFADDVENPFYDFYKKVWLETDKMCSHKEGE